MRTLVLCSVLLLLSTLNASSAFVASYQRTDGTIIDPIECWMADFSCTAAGDRDVHVYAGPNLEPLANLESAALGGWADLADADLRGANLTGADLFFANLAGANFVDANLNGAFLGNTIGAAFYNANTDFSGVYFSQSSQAFFFDPVAAGWTFVPETGRAHLVGFGLAGLAGRRR